MAPATRPPERPCLGIVSIRLPHAALQTCQMVQRLEENFQKAKLTETDENDRNNLEMLESLLKIETSHSEVAKVQPMASLMLGVFLGDTDPNHGRQMMI